MSNQVQCPNCGGYRVTTQTIYNGDPSYESRAASKRGWASLFLGWGALNALGFIPGLPFVVAVFGALDNMGVFFGIIIGLCIGVALPLWIGWTLRNAGDLSRATITRYHHTCVIDGYQWDQRPGQPNPPCRAQSSDLLRKGAKKLEEEEEERRRRMWD